METKPEQYLREIRELETQNHLLLSELVEHARKEEKRTKWWIFEERL